MIVIRKPDAHGTERVVMVNNGVKTQSVNLCTPANVQGQYEGWVRFKPEFFVNEEWFAPFPTYEATLKALRDRDYRQHNN